MDNPKKSFHRGKNNPRHTRRKLKENPEKLLQKLKEKKGVFQDSMEKDTLLAWDTLSTLKETFPKNINYPSWYQNVYATQDKILQWTEDGMTLETTVIFPNNTKKEMIRNLQITGKTFSITPARNQERNQANGENTKENSSEKNNRPRSVEW